MVYNKDKLYRSDDTSLISKNEPELLLETSYLLENSWEIEYVNSEIFSILCFLVSYYRRFGISNDFILSFLSKTEYSIENVLETIIEVFLIHEKTLPDNFPDVIKSLSEILKN